MDTILTINIVIAVVFTCCYAYQLFFLAVPFTKKQEPHKPEVLHRFAILICARNEEAVIADLIQSIRHQTYDQSLLTVFVMADNCTDATADIARREGAVVYTRFNREKVGKGYALEQLLLHIEEDYPKVYDGFFVFDADNLVDANFVADLNNSRMLLGTSCAVSGTGFLFSRQVMESTNGWKFHLLTEDIEFSVHHILQGRKIGFCADAVLYDEQPVTFRQSWRQRLRWARGFLQVFRKYGFGLVKGIGKGHFSCYDMSMTVMPAYILTVGLIIAYLVGGVMSTAEGISFLPCLMYILQTFLGLYVVLFLVGVFTTITEWKRIHTTPLRKVLYTVTFPLFMLTYIPISMVALFSRKVQWKPIEHHRADRRVLETAAGRK